MDIKEAIEHCREVADGCPAGDRDCAYQHDQLGDWLEELMAYRAALSLECAQGLVHAAKDGRLVVLPKGTVSMLMAKFVDKGDSDMLICSVETRGSEDHLLALLSLAASAVAEAHQKDYKLLLEAMMDIPPFETLSQAEAEEGGEK